jgi:thioredoxin-like negative regulator of GroEL
MAALIPARAWYHEGVVRLVLVGLALAACQRHGSSLPADDTCGGKAHAEGPLAWIADDYPGAMACARRRHVPLVVDLWAPWCHTCLSMKSTVLRDPSFTADHDRFVFVALDTDREANAPALARLSISAWPTYYVLDDDEQVLARFVGAGSVAQFHGFLDAGERARAGGVPAADAHLLGAQRALAIKDLPTADTELTAALAAAPATWSQRAETLGALILTKRKRGDYAGCLDVADRHMAETGNAVAASDFLVTFATCAEQAKDDARVPVLRERAVARWRQLLADPNAQLSVDDRADAMASLWEMLDALGRHDEALALAEQTRALLDDAASRAPTPLAAMTFNWPRAQAYAYLGRPLALAPALEQSAHDLPGEYDPRARLGWILWQAGKLDDAARWTDDALKMVYGPRKARLMSQRASIAEAAGDHAAAHAYREQVVALWEALPASQQSPDALAQAKAALGGELAAH